MQELSEKKIDRCASVAYTSTKLVQPLPKRPSSSKVGTDLFLEAAATLKIKGAKMTASKFLRQTMNDNATIHVIRRYYVHFHFRTHSYHVVP